MTTLIAVFRAKSTAARRDTNGLSAIRATLGTRFPWYLIVGCARRTFEDHVEILLTANLLEQCAFALPTAKVCVASAVNYRAFRTLWVSQYRPGVRVRF